MNRPAPVPGTTACFGCAPDNDSGLQLQISITPEGRAHAPWTPQPRFRGYNNISHGGAVAAVLDEMMGWALLIDKDPPHATFKLDIEYRAPHWIDKPYICEAWVEARRGKAIKTAAELRCADTGAVTAKATATFVRLPEEKLNEFMG